MVRIIGCILMITGCTAIGFWNAECMRRRLQEMQELKRYVLFMKGEICCRNRTLPETLLELEKKAKGIWKKFFHNTGRSLEKMEEGTLAEIWKKEMTRQLSGSYLKEREKKEWLTLGENLGYLDMEMQLHMLEIFQVHLSESMEEEREEVKSQSKLSRILGIMSGIFLTVLLI